MKEGMWAFFFLHIALLVTCAINNIQVDDPLLEGTLNDDIYGGAPGGNNNAENVETRVPSQFHRHDFQDYLPYDEIVKFMEKIKENYGDLVNMTTIGKTYEKREMYVLHISKPGRSEKPAIFIDAGIHGRESIAPATALYVIDQLLQPTNRYLLNNVDFYILPVLNPDGYHYALSKDRYWRKSRSPTKNPKCPGVDLNRNFDVGWNRKWWCDPCKDTFGGYKAFSEPETRNFRDFFLGIKDSVKVYLTLHSFGQLLLYPWSYKNRAVKNEETLQGLAARAAEAVKSATNHEYRIGRSSRILYFSGGTSADWAMQEGGVDFSYTIELPDFGRGFHPCATYIPKAGREMFEILKVFIGHLETPVETANTTLLQKSHKSKIDKFVSVESDMEWTTLSINGCKTQQFQSKYGIAITVGMVKNVLQCLKAEAEPSNLKISRKELNLEVVRRKKKYIQLDERIDMTTEKYEENKDVPKFLKTMSYILKLD